MTINAWKEQTPYLVDAYLQLKQDGALNSDTTQGGWPIEVIGLDHTCQWNFFKSPTHVVLEYGSQYFVHANDARHTNETLLRHGYIGASPEKVSNPSF
jgi:hypothetical protein